MKYPILISKNFLILPISLILSLLLLVGCWGYPYLPTLPTTPTPPFLPAYLTEIVVQPDTMNLEEGESQNIISVTAYYSDSSTANIPLSNCTYDSYNPSCATANLSGLITGVSTGTAVILVIYTEGVISKNDTITINVTNTPITPAILSYIEVLPSVMSLSVGELQTFNSVTANYSDSSSANVNLATCNYSSSNPDCATVSNSGTVSAVSDGSSTITISYTEDGVTKTTSAEITVGTVIQNEVVYRALCVGVGDYILGSDNDLNGPPYDVDRIRQVLQQCQFDTSNTTFSNINYSGGFIGKSMDETIISKEKLESFNDEVINVFSQAEYKGLLTTNEYKVLTSCHSSQECMELSPLTPGDFDPFGVFTLALCAGCGYYGSYPADTNLDTAVSLQETYLYVKSYVADLDAQLPDISITQDVQVYPNNSSFTIVEY